MLYVSLVASVKVKYASIEVLTLPLTFPHKFVKMSINKVDIQHLILPSFFIKPQTSFHVIIGLGIVQETLKLLQ